MGRQARDERGDEYDRKRSRAGVNIMKVKLRVLLPLALFGIMVAFLAIGLALNPRLVPSPLIEKPAPDFQLPELHDPTRTVGLSDLKGQVSLLNVWASWCVACRQEHPLFMELSASSDIPVYGLNYKDERSDAIQWLSKLGDPYEAIAADRDGRVGIDWGVYGVPETFVIDKRGIIRYKHIGPIDTESLRDTVIPLVLELRREEG
jgi:cytochrome c biogenesis protein CcmG/thiol:disulfide interchange protein DsbE